MLGGRIPNRFPMASRTDDAPSQAGFDDGCLLPSQFYTPNKRPRAFDGETRLMVAVLADAIHCYLRDLDATAVTQRIELAELGRWFNARDERNVFGFQNLCEVLGIDAERLRKSLRAEARGRRLSRVRSEGVTGQDRRVSGSSGRRAA